MGKYANMIKHLALHLIISCNILGVEKIWGIPSFNFPSGFQVTSRMSTYRAWFFHLVWYQLGVNLFKSTKPPSGIQCLENWRLHILSVYSYKSFSKFVVNLLASEIWPALFKEYITIPLLCLLYTSLCGSIFYQELFSDISFAKWLGFEWPILPN